MNTSVRLLLCIALTLATLDCAAATLHGRVKDRQCSVLSRVTVTLKPLHAAAAAPATTVITNDSGDYTATLGAGTYQACFQRENTTLVCEEMVIPASGDTWITTQLRDAAPDLSHIGNHAY